MKDWSGCGRRWHEGLEEEVVIVAWTGKDSGVWKVIARSNDKAFGEAAKGLNFSRGPSSGVSGLTFSVTVPFLSKEVLPFDVKAGRKLPST